jgi:glucose-6-phosphate 1-dehydrogenase
MKDGLQKYSRTKQVDDTLWKKFASQLFYCQGDFGDASAYEKLGKLLDGFNEEALKCNLLFYLATSPSQFAEVSEHLHHAGLLSKEIEGGFFQRLVVEKPLGHDLASARQLNQELTRFAHERQIYRIDHYLGKETVQNLLMFRFSNAIFEQLWNRQAVDHVQITVSEKLGVGSRGGYYEESGALRDMVQNHLLQILALVAMEPPVSLEAESIRDEKVKLLKSIRAWVPGQISNSVVRGQYLAGRVDGEPRPAYREETNTGITSLLSGSLSICRPFGTARMMPKIIDRTNSLIATTAISSLFTELLRIGCGVVRGDWFDTCASVPCPPLAPL